MRRIRTVLIVTAFAAALMAGGTVSDGQWRAALANPAAASPSPAPNGHPGISIADLADRLLPTVVNVSTTTAVENIPLPEMPEFPEGSPFDEFFREFFEQQRRGGQGLPPQKATSLGSGFIIDAEKGLIVTNNHVIKDADEIKITLHDDTTLDAEVVGTDEKTDIALIKVKTERKLTAVAWGDSDAIRVGEWVIAIGNPFGLGGTVTAGIVSARQRNINAGPYDDFIQTDASINRGNSGGPMFNMKGEVIGINTAIFTPSGGSVGIGFAVPSAIAKGVIDQLVKYGKTRRGWLGVRIQQVTDDIAQSLGLKETMGAMVASTTPGGPAEKAGMKPGDVITEFNGTAIREMRNLPRTVAETEVGTTVPVKIWRKGKEIETRVTLGQLEEAEESGLLAGTEEGEDGGKTATPPGAVQAKELGLELAAMTDELRKKYSINPDSKGVVITGVDADSDAASKAVLPGDVIVEVDQEPVTTPADVQKRLEAAMKAKRNIALLFIDRQGDMRFVGVKIGDGKAAR